MVLAEEVLQIERQNADLRREIADLEGGLSRAGDTPPRPFGLLRGFVIGILLAVVTVCLMSQGIHLGMGGG
jgi:hypothetical protein